MVTSADAADMRFTLSFHYEQQVRASCGLRSAQRMRRLAQEAVTLSTSLPISAPSSIFVRADEERLDVLKVYSTVLYTILLLTDTYFTVYSNL